MYDMYLQCTHTTSACTDLCMCKYLDTCTALQLNVCKYVCINECLCVFVFVSLYHCARQAGSVMRWQSKALYVCLCVWSRCAWPPHTACCPSVLPSVCRLRPRFANRTTPLQEDPGERDAERWGEGWTESERCRVGGGGEERKDEGRSRYRRARGITRLDDRKGEKRKSKGVVVQETTYKLIGNGLCGWQWEGDVLNGGCLYSFLLFLSLCINHFILTSELSL